MQTAWLMWQTQGPVHHLIVCKDRRDGVHAAREGFAKHKDVGVHGIVVAGQGLASPAQPRLDLVCNQERVVLLQQRVRPRQVPVIGYDDSRFTLRSAPPPLSIGLADVQSGSPCGMQSAPEPSSEKDAASGSCLGNCCKCCEKL